MQIVSITLLISILSYFQQWNGVLYSLRFRPINFDNTVYQHIELCESSDSPSSPSIIDPTSGHMSGFSMETMYKFDAVTPGWWKIEGEVIKYIDFIRIHK